MSDKQWGLTEAEQRDCRFSPNDHSSRYAEMTLRLDDQIRELRAENERLRARLRHIAKLKLGCNCAPRSDCCAAMDGTIEGNRTALNNESEER